MDSAWNSAGGGGTTPEMTGPMDQAIWGQTVWARLNDRDEGAARGG